MFELKEVGRLYTAESGYRLIVGKFDHPLDAERTAAKHYFHRTGKNNKLYRGDSMQELRVNIEQNTTIVALGNKLDDMVNFIMGQRTFDDETETGIYELYPNINDFKKV